MDNLNQLRTFLSVYRTGSVSRAAERVNLTQPAATKQLQQLEARLQRQLFTRVARGVTPTAAGHELARRVQPHLDALETLAASLKIGATGLAGTVFVGGPAEFLGAKLLPALPGLHLQEIQLRVRLAEPEALQRDLLAGALDIAVFTVRRSHPKLEFSRLYQEELVLVGSRTWLTRFPRTGLSAEILTGVPLLSYAEELPLIRRYWRKVFGKLPTASASLVVPDLRSLQLAAVAGAGVTVLPRYLIESAVHAGALTELHKPADPPINQLYLGWRGDNIQPRVQFVLDLIERASSGW